MVSKKIILSIFNRLFKAFGPQNWWPGETPFEVALGAILTQNTNWQNVERAILNLRREGVIEPFSIYSMDLSKLASLIRPVGYYNVKARRIKEFVSFLVREFHGNMELMKEIDGNILRKRLLLINGIGFETADSILLYALDKPFFVVDSYTRRVMIRHGLIHDDMGYEDIQGIFHRYFLDKCKTHGDVVKFFNEFHALFVKVGKIYCNTEPCCQGCPLDGIKRRN